MDYVDYIPAIIARIKLKSFKLVPTGFQNVVEIIVEVFDNFATNALGKNLSYIAPWYFMVFVFIFSSSMFSIFGLRAPTADWATTFALAFASFSLMIIMGFKHQKGQYLKSFFNPHFVFFPLNLIGELAKPVSLSFRLLVISFRNNHSDTILFTNALICPVWHTCIITCFFDVIFGTIQTYIFVIISIMYVESAAS